MKLTPRNILILKIIIEEYLKTGKVLGSKMLLKKFSLGVSPATVRGDMAKLEKLNLIFQPYHSAGRLPTSQGIRAYIDYMMQETPSYFLNKDNINLLENITTFYEYIFNKVFILGENTKELAFMCISEQNILEYSGISYFIEKNKNNFLEESLKIISMIEDKIRFINFIDNLHLKDGINLFIGDENYINYLKQFSIIIKPIIINNKKGYIGIIGNIKQDYNFNMNILKSII